MSAVEIPALPDTPASPVYTPGMSTVLSIWPFDQTHMTYHAGIITYGHPAAEKDKIKFVQMNPDRVCLGGKADGAWMSRYTTQPVRPGVPGYTRIDVYDTFTAGRNWVAESESRPVVIDNHPITSIAVADMLVRTFSGGRSGDHIYGAPGLCVYDPTKPIESQLSELDHKQRLFAEGLINEAENFAAQREFRNITTVHRNMAAWLGYVPKDWGIASMRRVGQTKPCPNCNQDIPLRALKCTATGCGINLVEFFDSYGIGATDDAVQDIVKLREKLAAEKHAVSQAMPSPQAMHVPKPNPAPRANT